jgi:hypothetical protein
MTQGSGLCFVKMRSKWPYLGVQCGAKRWIGSVSAILWKWMGLEGDLE